ncbi:MAG: patatin-like phospholipase family protein [Rhodospirillales bacterium]|nr:patatin-like phospholipase family protein [Rhodospirillales bacterium]
MKANNELALALQGGGVHGAYAWGVLDRLLEDGLAPTRVCGVSSGALLAAMLVQGLVKGGAAGARREMRRLWDRIAQAHALNPLQNGPLERWLWGWDLSNSFLWQGMEAAMRLFSPAQLNPFGHNPLRPVISDLLDRDALRHPSAITLTIAATDVETSGSRQWGNAAVTVDTLLASCCLPMVFQAVEIDGRAYWDGGYSGNPPLAPLLRPTLPRELVLIRAQPAHRPGAPHSPAEVLNRLNEIACHGVLEAELANLPASIRLTSYDADRVLGDLPLSSKFNADTAFLTHLFEAGRTAARAPADVAG